MSERVVLVFEPPTKLLSMNDSVHWSEQNPHVQAWREAAYFHACEQLPPGPANRRLEGRQRVRVMLPVTTRHRRDWANFMATVKPIVDGLTDANLWPDDTPEYVTVSEPVLSAATRDVVVVLEPADCGDSTEVFRV